MTTRPGQIGVHHHKDVYADINDTAVNTGPDPGFSVGGVDPFWGGFGLQRGHFSVKMYAKTKELGPVGGRASARPPRSAYGIY